MPTTLYQGARVRTKTTQRNPNSYKMGTLLERVAGEKRRWYVQWDGEEDKVQVASTTVKLMDNNKLQRPIKRAASRITRALTPGRRGNRRYRRLSVEKSNSSGDESDGRDSPTSLREEQDDSEPLQTPQPTRRVGRRPSPPGSSTSSEVVGTDELNTSYYDDDEEDSDDDDPVVEIYDPGANDDSGSNAARPTMPPTQGDEDKYSRERYNARAAKERLIAAEHTVAIEKKSPRTVYEWRVVADTDCKEPFPDFPREEIGLKEFTLEAYPHSPLFPHSEAFLRLWPGDPKDQLNQLNTAMKDSGGKPVSEKEFWCFIAGMLLAPMYPSGGNAMFAKSRSCFAVQVTPLDEIIGMSKNRFNTIRQFIPHAFRDLSKQGDASEWWQISKLITGFNSNRATWVRASRKKIMDENMSAMKPRTTKSANLDHLSFIQRKPEPLGTELKSVACSVTKVILHLEIQKGKDVMREAKYNRQFGATAGCTMRLALATANSGQTHYRESGTSNLFAGDAWFAGVTAARELRNKGHEFVGIVKTNHSLYPKQFIESTMKDWPAGEHLVLKLVSGADDLVLYAIGYKYSKKAVICFIATEHAGCMMPGRPYYQRFTDEVGNVHGCAVERFELASTYWDMCNAIDVHNQRRQSELALEKKFVTQNGFFRIFTTVLGMTCVDAYLLFRRHVPPHCLKEFDNEIPNTVSWANKVAWELLQGDWCELAEPALVMPRTPGTTALVDLIHGRNRLARQVEEEREQTDGALSINREASTDLVLEPTDPPGAAQVPELFRVKHSFRKINDPNKRKRCCDPHCIDRGEKKSMWLCVDCNKAYCDDSMGKVVMTEDELTLAETEDPILNERTEKLTSDEINYGRRCYYTHYARLYMDSGAADVSFMTQHNAAQERRADLLYVLEAREKAKKNARAAAQVRSRMQRNPKQRK